MTHSKGSVQRAVIEFERSSIQSASIQKQLLGSRQKPKRKAIAIRRPILLVLTVILVTSLSGCSTVLNTMSKVREEQRITKITRMYGKELPHRELGPYAGYTREEYFKHKCDTEAGEFIYKTVENVEGVYQMRLRDPRDLIDRLRKYDFPEDLWGHTNVDARTPSVQFLRHYKYFETTKEWPDRGDRWSRHYFASKPNPGSGKYLRHSLGEPDGNEYYSGREGESFYRPSVIESSDSLKSQYGYTWREVRDKYDRHFGVWGGELIIKDLATDETLAISKGFASPGSKLCPPRGPKMFVREFVRKVLIPKNLINKEINKENSGG